MRSDLTERQYLEAREDVAIQTVNLFFDVYAARVALETATRNAAVNDTLYTLNKGRYEVGRIGENDLLQSELALLRARTNLDGARLEYDRAAAALRMALNLAIDAPLEVTIDALVPTFEADTARAVAEALRNRAAVSDVALQEVQARRRITEARLAQGLGATVSASYGYNATGDELSRAYHDLQEARQFSLSLPVPPLAVGGAQGDRPGRRSRSGPRRQHRSHDDQADHAGGALRRAPAVPGAPGPGAVGQGGYRRAEAVRGGLQPLRDRPDHHRQPVHRAEREGRRPAPSSCRPCADTGRRTTGSAA